eukprot:886682-Rhodomonas_salina.2
MNNLGRIWARLDALGHRGAHWGTLMQMDNIGTHLDTQGHWVALGCMRTLWETHGGWDTLGHIGAHRDTQSLVEGHWNTYENRDR